MDEQSTAANPTLHVVFAGLCMLVRDESNRQLHVLLPTDHKHAGHDGGPVKHEACLIHDVAYGATGTVTDQMSKIDLKGVVLDMRDLGGEKPPCLKVEGVVDEECMQGTPVKRGYLTAIIPEKPVKSRISIGSGWAGRNVPGALWQLGDCPEQTMAVSAEWIIRPTVNAGTVDISVQREGVASTLKLTPPADGHMYLFILHIPEGTLLPTLPTFPYEPSGVPTDDPEAKHFRAFYPLIGRSKDVKGPIYKGKPKVTTGQTEADQANKGREEVAGFDYGCMLATARAAS